jgi:hypothetical protein
LGAVRKDWAHFHGVWHEIYLEVNSLTFGVDDENLGVILAFEVDLLKELLVNVGSEHHVDCLLLAWEESSCEGEHLETFASFFSFL